MLSILGCLSEWSRINCPSSADEGSSPGQSKFIWMDTPPISLSTRSCQCRRDIIAEQGRHQRPQQAGCRCHDLGDPWRPPAGVPYAN